MTAALPKDPDARLSLILAPSTRLIGARRKRK